MASRLCNLKREICQVLNKLIENREMSQEDGLDSKGVYIVIRSIPIMSHDQCQDAIPRG